MSETRHTFCRICESLCGLEVDVEAGRVVAARPDPQHVATRGFACPKGLKQHLMYGSPDRLEHPLRRTQDGLQEPTTWGAAMEGIGAAVRRIRAAHGPDSVAMYVGTAAGFSVLHPIFAQGFMTGLGSRSMYASATQDCANKFAVANEVYGFPFTQPFPDVDRTQHLIIVGANPVVSKWSFLQVPNPQQRIKAIQARGGRVVVVDPRRTETAKVASEHVFIRPGTDVFFYLAFLHEVLRRGAVDRARVEAHMRGLDAVGALAERWSPERCAEATQISPDVLRRMVDEYLAAEGGAALYCSTGVNMGGHGALAFWLQEVINAVTGNLDRPGGTLVGHGVMDFPAFGKKNGVLTRTDRSRVGGFVSVNDAFPGGVLADEILTEGPGQVRALFVTGGNPLLTMANAGRLKEAFSKLELLVVLDILPTETAALAHYVLPCTSPYQRADLPFIFPLMLGLQAQPYLQATRAVEARRGAQRDEASIYLELCEACGVGLFGSSVAQGTLTAAARLHQAAHGLPFATLPEEALLSLLLRVTGQGSFSALARAPHGRLRPGHAGGDFLGRRVCTDDGKVHLAPPRLMAQAAGLGAAFLRETAPGPRPLRLITKRHVKTHNSWTHNLPEFVAGAGADTNHLYMHPDDAAARGLADGALADVRSAVATVRVPVRLLAELMPGTVALPHGWGHQGAPGLSVARRTRGVNVNLLAADGPEHLEPVSGMAKLTALPVEVAPAAGPQQPTWSGL
jgi:anaerobic selenocysteine-containing dehydrogenase